MANIYKSKHKNAAVVYQTVTDKDTAGPSVSSPFTYTVQSDGLYAIVTNAMRQGGSVTIEHYINDTQNTFVADCKTTAGMYTSRVTLVYAKTGDVLKMTRTTAQYTYLKICEYT